MAAGERSVMFLHLDTNRVAFLRVLKHAEDLGPR
jgi:hypothetical protein